MYQCLHLYTCNGLFCQFNSYICLKALRKMCVQCTNLQLKNLPCLLFIHFYYFKSLSVRVVQSSRAGMGKSLIVKHLAERLARLPNNKKLREGLVLSLCPTIPVHGIAVNGDRVTRTLLTHAVKKDIPVSRIFHLDVSQSVSSTHRVIKAISVFYLNAGKIS